MKKNICSAALAAFLVCGVMAAPASAAYYDPHDDTDRYDYDHYDHGSYFPTDDPIEGFYFFEDTPNVTGKQVQKDAGTMSTTVGATLDLSKELIFDNNSEESPIQICGEKSWSSNRPEIASVDKNGLLTAKKTGYANITVSYYDNRANHVTQKLRIKVTEKTVRTQSYSFSVSEGKSLRLKELLFPEAAAGSVTWISSHPDILAVDSTGLVTPMRFGSGKITATHTGADGVAVTRTVPVRISSTQLSELAGSITISMNAGDKVDLVDMLHPNYTGANTYGTITCSTSDAAVVEISGHTATAKASGTCTVSLTCIDPNSHESSASRQVVTVKVFA